MAVCCCGMASIWLSVNEQLRVPLSYGDWHLYFVSKVLCSAEKHTGTLEGDARASKTKCRCRSNLEREEGLESFNVAASFKNRQSRCDIVLGRDQASYWRRTPLTLTALHGTTET